MTPLSAADAIGPAFTRTKLVLFSPFRFGRTWKLAATNYLGRIGTFFIPFPLIYIPFLFFIPQLHGKILLISAATGGIVLLTALYVWVFHLCSRIQFVCFDMVVNREQFVRTAWRKYGSHREWTIFKMVLGSVLSLIIVVPMFWWMIRLFAKALPVANGGQTFPVAFTAFLLIYFFAMLVFMVCILGISLVGDFALPSLALENTTLKEALRRPRELVRNEPGQMALYTLLKAVLAVVGYLGLLIAFEIVLLIVVLAVVLTALLVGFILHKLGIPMVVLQGIGIVLGIAAEIFVVFYGIVLIMGILMTFLEAYALFFLGGRYPLLGDLIDRTTPQSTSAPQIPLQSPPDALPSMPS